MLLRCGAGRLCWIVFMSFVLGLAGRPARALAQTGSTASGSYDLGRVVVSGVSEKGAQAVETVSTVTAKQIKQEGARTLDEALQLLPGVTVRTGADGTPRIDIRGFRTRNVLLLLNGTPFNGSYDGQFDPSLIPVDNIAEIKVITGGASILYGPGGNGGVINIITKKGQPGLHGSVQAEGAQGASYLVNGTLSGATQHWDGFVSGGGFSRDGFPLSNDFTATAYQDKGLRNNSDFQRQDAFANVGYSPSTRTYIGGTFSFMSGDRGIPPVDNYSQSDPFASKLKFEREDDIKNYSGQLAVHQNLFGPFSLKGWAYFNSLYMVDNYYDNENYDTQLLKGSSRTDSTTDISGANLQLRCNLARYGAATFGVMLENDHWDADGFTQVQAKKTAPVTRQYFDETDSFMLNSVLFQYTVNPVKRLDLVLGSGFHWQDRKETTKEDYTYLIGASYELFPGTRLRAYHSRKIRFPSLQDLYDPNGGNPNLVPERTLHYEGGIEQTLPADTTLSLDGFYVDVNNFIEKNSEGISENFEKYRFSGFEIGAENRYFKNLVVRATYTYLNAVDLGTDSSKDQLQYRPKDKVALAGDYRFPWGTSLYASVMYEGYQYFYSKNDLEKKRLSGYTLVDLKLSQSFRRNSLEVYVGARNLLDKNYEQSYGLPQAGRTVYGGVRYRF